MAQCNSACRDTEAFLFLSQQLSLKVLTVKTINFPQYSQYKNRLCEICPQPLKVDLKKALYSVIIRTLAGKSDAFLWKAFTETLLEKGKLMLLRSSLSQNGQIKDRDLSPLGEVANMKIL